MFNRSRPQLRVCARPVHIGLLAALLAAAALSLETQSSEAVTDGTPGSNHRQAFAENAAYEIPHTGSANSTATFSTGVPTSTGFTVRRGETTYHADSSVSSYTGSLKSVVESAADDLNARGGGTIAFEAGDFDLGGDWFELTNLQDIVFQGQGIDVTFLRNFTSVSTDTEPFDFSWSDRITIRDFTISAGGPPRNSSDAIDFDGGDANLIERVKITSSRGDGIIFDGKDLGQTADGNIVRNCILTDIPRDGIQFLASSHNVVENCQIIDVGAVGIRIHRASAVAAQPNKASNDNVLTGNLIRNAGEYGIRINGGERNLVSDNTILNSSDDRPNRDAVRINDAAPCRDNIVRFNTATDTQTPKTQAFGLNIASPACEFTIVQGNDFSGNRLGEINDTASNTIYLDAAGNLSSGCSTVELTSPAVISTLTFAPTDDVSVSERYPTTNFASESDLWVDGRDREDTILRFAISGINSASISRVQLRLYVTDSSQHRRHRLSGSGRRME